jgi:hypothetical protein
MSDTKTVRIDKDEWHPVYSIVGNHGKEAELTDAEITTVEAAFDAFDAAQLILRTALDKRSR